MVELGIPGCGIRYSGRFFSLQNMRSRTADLEKKQIVLFNVVQVVANLAAWVIVAPVLDIVIYAVAWPTRYLHRVHGTCRGNGDNYYWYSWYFDRSRILQVEEQSSSLSKED